MRLEDMSVPQLIAIVVKHNLEAKIIDYKKKNKETLIAELRKHRPNIDAEYASVGGLEGLTVPELYALVAKYNADVVIRGYKALNKANLIKEIRKKVPHLEADPVVVVAQVSPVLQTPPKTPQLETTGEEEEIKSEQIVLNKGKKYYYDGVGHWWDFNTLKQTYYDEEGEELEEEDNNFIRLDGKYYDPPMPEHVRAEEDTDDDKEYPEISDHPYKGFTFYTDPETGELMNEDGEIVGKVVEGKLIFDDPKDVPDVPHDPSEVSDFLTGMVQSAATLRTRMYRQKYFVRRKGKKKLKKVEPRHHDSDESEEEEIQAISIKTGRGSDYEKRHGEMHYLDNNTQKIYNKDSDYVGDNIDGEYVLHRPFQSPSPEPFGEPTREPFEEEYTDPLMFEPITWRSEETDEEGVKHMVEQGSTRRSERSVRENRPQRGNFLGERGETLQQMKDKQKKASEEYKAKMDFARFEDRRPSHSKADTDALGRTELWNADGKKRIREMILDLPKREFLGKTYHIEKDPAAHEVFSNADLWWEVPPAKVDVSTDFNRFQDPTLITKKTLESVNKYGYDFKFHPPPNIIAWIKEQGITAVVEDGQIVKI